MARARNIKPGFFKNADLVELPFETRLLFAGLWTLADRAGRLEDRPRQIKMELFPADSVDVDSMLNGLQRWGFVRRYEVNGQRLIQIVNFRKHQNPHKDEKVSALPAEDGTFDAPRVKPQEQTEDDTMQARCEDDAGTVGIGLIPDSLIPDSRSPITETLTEKPQRKRRDPPPPCPDDVNGQVWSDWVQLRKDKRANVSQTTVEEARKEAAKAGLSLESFLRIWCARGSQGLQADWLKPHERAGPQRQPTAAEARALQAVPSIAAPHLRQSQALPFVEEVPHEPAITLD